MDVGDPEVDRIGKQNIVAFTHAAGYVTHVGNAAEIFKSYIDISFRAKILTQRWNFPFYAARRMISAISKIPEHLGVPECTLHEVMS